jgi:hypothetical protein
MSNTDPMVLDMGGGRGSSLPLFGRVCEICLTSCLPNFWHTGVSSGSDRQPVVFTESGRQSKVSNGSERYSVVCTKSDRQPEVSTASSR